jgi:predicted nucleic acid-binding protein
MVYVDTNILIYLLEDTGASSVRTADIFERLKSQGHEFMSSVLSITEFLAGTTGGTLEMLQSIPGLSFHPIGELVAVEAGLLQQKSTLRIGDCLHLAAALDLNCDILFTNDRKFSKIASKHITVQNID